jgi:hypothetical protein
LAGLHQGQHQLEKNPLEEWIESFRGWKATFDQLRERIGWPGAVLLLFLAVGGFFWRKLEDIILEDIIKRLIRWLGLERFIKRFKKK